MDKYLLIHFENVIEKDWQKFEEYVLKIKEEGVYTSNQLAELWPICNVTKFKILD